MKAADQIARVALLIAAHGERTPGATNEGVRQIAREISALGQVSEVAVGFINGSPTVGEALAALDAPGVIVYPLFASSGYFTRDRLVGLLDEANERGRDVEVLPPLGLDPGLPDLVVDHAATVGRARGFAPDTLTVILLAHGSRRNSASREATDQVARAIECRAVFGGVGIALLEERPHLDEAMARVPGPAVVVGMFSGEGLHGARDAPRLIAALNRLDVVYAGVIGNVAGVNQLVAASVAKAMIEQPSLGG